MENTERRKDYPNIIERLVRIEERQISAERAVCVATSAMEKRLEGMNEFRDTLKDQAGRFITRDELSLVVEKIDVDIRILRESKAELSGKASQQSVNVTMFASYLSLTLGLLNLFLRLWK